MTVPLLFTIKNLSVSGQQLYIMGEEETHYEDDICTDFCHTLVYISLSRQMLGMSFGVLVCVPLLTLAICFAGHLQVSVLSLTLTFKI